MSITGTGTQADPFVVTTYSELVSKITNPDSLSECYIKIGNDINIADEYPFGDMPILDFGVNVFLDGDGKTIFNWYYTGNSNPIAMKKYPCRMENLDIRNIVYKPASTSTPFLYVFLASSLNITAPLIEKCTFVGELFGYFCTLFSNSSAVPVVRSSVFNLLCHDGIRITSTSGGVYGLHFESCNMEIVAEGNGNGLLNFRTSHCPKNSYFDISIPNASPAATYILSDGGYDNCIIRLSTPLGSTASSQAKFGVQISNASVSIINTSASSGVEPDGSQTQLKEVTDQNWHDIAYLQSIGFSAGARTEGQ